MPVSEKKRAANRRNAAKSTGPKTVRGKAASSRNAVKHALHARDVLVTSPHLRENPDDYNELLASLRTELKPESTLQEHLVRQIANCLWRSRRAVVAETAELNSQLTRVDDDLENLEKWKDRFGIDTDQDPRLSDLENQARAVIVGRRALLNRDVARNILWYEMRMDRQMTRAYFLLKSLQQNHLGSEPEDDASQPRENSTTKPPSDCETAT